ncbi:Transposase [Mycobacterium canettii CIPT 140070008]|nr:Transposase [Mycobacterium canettii CIPT 140070008]
MAITGQSDVAADRSETQGADNDVRNVRLFRALLGVDKRTVIEDIEFEEDDAGDGARVIARVRPRSAVLRRCGRCGRKASWYDRGAGLRQWRSLDWGTVEVFLEAEAP